MHLAMGPGYLSQHRMLGVVYPNGFISARLRMVHLLGSSPGDFAQA